VPKGFRCSKSRFTPRQLQTHQSPRCPVGHGSLAPDGQIELQEFFRQAQVEGLLDRPLTNRLAEACADLTSHGAVSLSEAELTLGARLAWRNHARCIGRLFWKSLLVRDRRAISDGTGMYAELCEHIREATRQGQIRPVLTAFAPAERGCPAPRIRNRQLFGYAAYRDGSSILGDPLNLAFTDEAIALGWEPPKRRSAFDLLPWILVGRGEKPALFPVPTHLVKEVPLLHPTLPWFRELGLKWYAVPIVCDIALRIAGTEFPAAPFSGWYMGTEIGCRNLGDENRYNLLPVVARRMGLPVDSKRSLWREHAMVELNVAVLHSFAEAGVRIVDHHTASEEFVRFCALEAQAGRAVSADWDWIVPPLAGSSTRVFHQPMQDLQLRPEFWKPPA
jgi:nitric-oxide synthase